MVVDHVNRDRLRDVLERRRGLNQGVEWQDEQSVVPVELRLRIEHRKRGGQPGERKLLDGREVE